METLRRLRYIAKSNDHFVSFDLRDGFYSLSIHPKDREAVIVNLDGHSLWLCDLPIRWSMCPYTFQKFTDVFVNKLRNFEATARPSRFPNISAKAKKKWLCSQRMRTGRPAKKGISPLPAFWDILISPFYISERGGPGGRNPPEKLKGPGGGAPRKIFNS